MQSFGLKSTITILTSIFVPITLNMSKLFQDDLALAIVEGDLATIEDIFGAYTVLYGDGDLSVGVLHGYSRGGGFYRKMLEFRYDIDQRSLAIAINPDYSINCYSKNEAPKQVTYIINNIIM